MKQIIITTPGSISEADKTRLQENKIVLIEHPKPNEVRIVHSMEGLEGDDIMAAMLEADKQTTNASFRNSFAQAFFKTLKDRISPKKV